MGGEVIDFPLLFEKLLSSNDESFPTIMEFLRTNNIVPKLSDVYAEIGYTFVNSNCDASDSMTRWRLITNLMYLRDNKCDLNLEMFNFLRSLTFGGKIVKRGKNYLDVIQILLPFCTDFFLDFNTWKKIRYFSSDTKEIVNALSFLVANYGTEKNYKFFPALPKYEPFTLKHLARNKVREIVWQNKKTNQTFLTFCKDNLPVMLFGYMKFEN